MRVACVGDSLTRLYPALLDRLVSGADVRGFDVDCTSVLSSPGCSTNRCGCLSYRATQAWADALAWAPDTIVAQFGTSDSARPWYDGWGSEFEDGFENFIATVQSRNVSVVLVRPPPLFSGKENRNATITNALYGHSFERIQRKTGALLVDGHAKLLGHRDKFDDDGVHPTCAGAAKLAKSVRGVLVENFDGLGKRNAEHLCPFTFAEKCEEGHYECVLAGLAAAVFILLAGAGLLAIRRRRRAISPVKTTSNVAPV